MEKYVLKENGKTLHKSGSLEKLINYTTNTENAEIYYNGILVWVQNTEKYWNDNAKSEDFK